MAFYCTIFSRAKQSSPDLHWKLQVLFISFQQVRLNGSDKKSRNWRTHRHHLWKMSVKWCDLNPHGIQAASGRKWSSPGQYLTAHPRRLPLAPAYSLHTFPVSAANNAEVLEVTAFLPIAVICPPVCIPWTICKSVWNAAWEQVTRGCTYYHSR